MSLFRISASSHNAASRTVEKAQQATELGYSDVQTHYQPGQDGQPGTHSVTGTPPAVPDSPKRGLLRR
ncbi:hypothetical protein OG689_10825 [Kitasatospora sp. NBC_00240]|uniref:hypothetical protein n=1 Tax=Kitasatospora sp. NBC_00240 TaxID=2903567 RepID=UPI002250C3F1|nr:hypothetical protein [Kitasatospora sp. NBC_00240]MCX5209777.1 hypothetical protein [Kitasatospora sp. NBC_00240]